MTIFYDKFQLCFDRKFRLLFSCEHGFTASKWPPPRPKMDLLSSSNTIFFVLTEVVEIILELMPVTFTQEISVSSLMITIGVPSTEPKLTKPSFLNFYIFHTIIFLMLTQIIFIFLTFQTFFLIFKIFLRFRIS